jgi:methionyl-tRNA formyltransferase
MTSIVFMGSPEFAIPILRSLADKYKVVGVVTQPDRPSGRGRNLKSPPIKLLAEELFLPVIQPLKLSDPEAMENLQHWAPDLIVVAAFGQILRLEVLSLPHFGCINVHASLLPRWRGAAPIQAAILNGDEQTGITIMLMDPGIDTGPILSQASIPITIEETAGTLTSRLSELGAKLLTDCLPNYLNGTLVPEPQHSYLATFAPMIKKEAGLLNFKESSIDLERKIRAFNPWPGAYTFWKDQILKIHRAHAIQNFLEPAGKRIVYQEFPAIITSQGILVFEQLQPAGKNSMPGNIFLRGARGWEG